MGLQSESVLLIGGSATMDAVEIWKILFQLTETEMQLLMQSASVLTHLCFMSTDNIYIVFHLS